MKNKAFIFIPLVLGVFVEVCSAQVVSHKIQILDENTKEPVPFASVSFGHLDGVYCDSCGRFVLPEELVDSIAISHISYRTKIISPENVKDNIIFLVPVSYSLDEVIVTKYTGSITFCGTFEGTHHSGYAPFQYTVNALYIPYNETWVEAPQVNEVFLDLISFSGNHNTTIQYYLSIPDPINGSPSGKAISKQTQLTLDNEDSKIRNRYYSKIDEPFFFPKSGVFIVFFVADPSYSYVEMLNEWGTKRFKMSKYMPFSFYLTAKENSIRSWTLNIYSDGSSWTACDSNNEDWNKMVAGMNVRNEGDVYNFMGGVVVRFPK